MGAGALIRALPQPGKLAHWLHRGQHGVMTQTAPNRIDGTRPDSPCLSGHGTWPVGVQTLTLTDPARVDLDGETRPRPLTVELWYPAAPGTAPGGSYDTLLRDGETPVTVHGSAARDADPAQARWPLVLISHGYPGNRFLMSHLAEALASRGYLVAAADHPLSTYQDQGPFGATLYHRPLDQRFLLGALAGHPLALPDTAAVIGYSMGGYGALVTAGAGLVDGMEAHEQAPAGGLLAVHLARNLPLPPANLRAVIAFGPWGNGHGVWSPEGLSGIALPLLVIAGSVDTVSVYEGMRGIARDAGGTLQTFVNAGHNAGAPIPAPAESHAHSEKLGWAPFLHYADPVWDSVRMNAIAQHFAAAFLDRHLKGETARDALLAPVTALGAEAGFGDGMAAGLTVESWA